MDIIQAIHSEKIFRPLFNDLETWRSWIVFLKALFALDMSSDEAKSYRKCTGRKALPTELARESYVIAGRRSGKSYISALIAVFLAAFKDWNEHLSAGERPYIFIIATNKAQAKIIKNYISGFLYSIEIFRAMVRRDLAEEIELTNGITIAVKPISYRSLRGYTIVCAILEEIAFFRYETESANPDREVLAALKPALATIPDSLLLGISTPFSRQGILFEKYHKYFGKSEGPLIWQAETSIMNPTIDKSFIEESYKDDSEAAQAEWGACFRSDISAFIDSEIVEAAVVSGRYGLPFDPQNSYVGFIDSSGGRSDSFTMGIAYSENETEKIVLAVAREVRPPFRPASVVEEFSAVLKAYGISEVDADAYAGEWVTANFADHDINVINSKKSKSEIYLELLPLLNNGQIELLDNKKLVSQLKSLERKTRSGGRDQIDVFFGHDDLANAAAGACVMATNAGGFGFILLDWKW